MVTGEESFKLGLGAPQHKFVTISLVTDMDAKTSIQLAVGYSKVKLTKQQADLVGRTLQEVSSKI